MKKVLWFSRHSLNDDQLNDLKNIFGNDLEINQVNKTISSAKEIMNDILEADIVAVVAPLPLQIEFLNICKDKPLIISKNHRIVIDEEKVQFVHAGWTRVKKIVIEKEELSTIPLKV